LSLRLVEEMLLERGIVVSYETVRRWGKKFGPEYVRRLRRKRPSPNDVWHLDEVLITIAGKKHWLWRAVDQDGYVLDEIVQNRRNTKAAKRMLTRLLKKQGLAPRRMITDKLRSYGAAKRQVIRMSSTVRTRASTTGPRIPTCRCASGSGRYRVSVRQEACSASSRSSQPSVISSSQPAQNAPHFRSISTASNAMAEWNAVTRALA
jgi:transposase-like protein